MILAAAYEKFPKPKVMLKKKLGSHSALNVLLEVPYLMRTSPFASQIESSPGSLSPLRLSKE